MLSCKFLVKIYLKSSRCSLPIHHLLLQPFMPLWCLPILTKWHFNIEWHLVRWLVNLLICVCGLDTCRSLLLDVSQQQTVDACVQLLSPLNTAALWPNSKAASSKALGEAHSRRWCVWYYKTKHLSLAIRNWSYYSAKPLCLFNIDAAKTVWQELLKLKLVVKISALKLLLAWFG